MYKFNFTDDDSHIPDKQGAEPTAVVTPAVPTIGATTTVATTTIATTTAATSTPARIANPASTNCLEKGGQLVIKKRGDGGEYGLCYFEDNRACEEWALLNGRCPLGGVKTTGFDTIEEMYCAWSGGQTVAAPKAICTFKNGQKCPVEKYYNGTCSFMVE